MAKKRKPNEMLSSVIKESAPDGAFDILMSNEAFVLPDDIGVILTLDTQDPEFGGLSVKQKRQEDKGAIIEQIMGDRIQSLVTSEMLDEDILGIIPTPQSLDNMSDFSILVNAPYAWAIVQMDDDGSLAVHNIQTASFAEARRISDGDVSLREVMPDTWAWAANVDQEDSQDEFEHYNDAVQDLSLVEDFSGFGGDADASDFAQDDYDTGGLEQSVLGAPSSPFGGDEVDLDMDTGSISMTEAMASGEVPVVATEVVEESDWDNEVSEPDWGEPVADEIIVEDFDSSVEDVIEEDPEDDIYARYVSDNADRDVSVEEVRDSIVRRFAPEDLNLEIDMALFDETFSYPAPRLDYTPLGSQWLDNQVGLMVEQANAELANEHWANQSNLRERYVSMASRFGENVTKKMSITQQGTRFADMMKAAKDDYERSQQRSGEITAVEREEIIARFNKEAETAAQAAAESARSRVEAQNRPHRERLLGEVATRVEAQIEKRYVDNKAQVLELRASEAENWFDLGITRVIEALSKQSSENRNAEADLMDEWNARITAFMDENRKEDIARTQAELDKQAREDQVAQVRANSAAEIASIKDEMTNKVAALEAEMSRIRDKALSEQRARDDQWTAQLTAANLKVSQSTALADSMRANLDSVKDVITSQFETQIADLQREKKRLEERMQDESKAAARTRNVIIGITILVAVLAILVGIIGGFVMGTGYKSSAEPDTSPGIDIVTTLDPVSFT